MRLVLFGSLAIAAATHVNFATAASLTGSEGDVRSRPYLGDSTGGCTKVWKQYVAASGHSAYATTPYSRMAEAIICGSSINAGSKAAAEARALDQCNAGLKHWKMSAVRKCALSASK